MQRALHSHAASLSAGTSQARLRGRPVSRSRSWTYLKPGVKGSQRHLGSQESRTRIASGSEDSSLQNGVSKDSAPKEKYATTTPASVFWLMFAQVCPGQYLSRVTAAMQGHHAANGGCSRGRASEEGRRADCQCRRHPQRRVFDAAAALSLEGPGGPKFWPHSLQLLLLAQGNEQVKSLQQVVWARGIPILNRVPAHHSPPLAVCTSEPESDLQEALPGVVSNSKPTAATYSDHACCQALAAWDARGKSG